MMRIRKLLATATLAATLGTVSGQSMAQFDLMYCDLAGNPYCDGVSLNFDVPNLTVYGNQIGCHSDPLGGSIVYSLFDGVNLGVTYGHVGAYDDIAGEILFGEWPYPWRLIRVGTGQIINSGVMCQPTPQLEGSNARPAAGD